MHAYGLAWTGQSGKKWSMQNLLPHRRAIWAALAVALILLLIFIAMGRPPICACGTVKLWHGVVESAENSQHITDWYSPSHFIHGLLFYGAAHLLWRRWNLFGGRMVKWALPIAVAVEACWEILENTPLIIDRYREVTISWGYEGDSIVNSMADLGWMTLGFLFAARLPAWVSITLGIALELFTLVMIRDNLALNVLMLVWPLEAVKQWQSMG